MPERIKVRVVPNASRDEVACWQNDVLKIKIQAVPEDGKANKALCQFVAKRIGCPKRDVKIVAGEKSRNKVLEIPVNPFTGAGAPVDN